MGHGNSYFNKLPFIPFEMGAMVCIDSVMGIRKKYTLEGNAGPFPLLGLFSKTRFLLLYLVKLVFPVCLSLP